MFFLKQNSWNTIHTKPYPSHLKEKTPKYKLTQQGGAISNEYISNAQFCTIIITYTAEYLTCYLIEELQTGYLHYFMDDQDK